MSKYLHIYLHHTERFTKQRKIDLQENTHTHTPHTHTPHTHTHHTHTHIYLYTHTHTHTRIKGQWLLSLSV
jgi:hypothetical protein